MRRTISLLPTFDGGPAHHASPQPKSEPAETADLAGDAPSALPSAGLIDDDRDLSLKVEEALTHLDRNEMPEA